MRNTPKLKSSGWNLYWVISDGLEDCFVVARNSRSAKKVECDMNGFDPAMLVAERVTPIPSNIHRSFLNRCKKIKTTHSWPWYAGDWLLKKLDAQFRVIDGKHETLLDDTVYSTGFIPRHIGRKLIKKFTSDKIISEYGEEDSYTKSQTQLLTLLGLCVSRCQEIEHLIAHSFILGVNDPKKNNYSSINDMIDTWKRKTLGNMIKLIYSGYEIEPTFKKNLDLFLDMRNKLVHDLTISEQYDISTSWGQDETVAFLAFFEIITRQIRKAFRASLYASIDFGNILLIKNDENRKIILTKKQIKEASIFAAFFTPKP